MFTREEYENLINNSPLFEIDKESSPALYKTERYNFFTLLTDYYRLYIYPNKSLESYSITLMDTAMECIKYYDKNANPETFVSSDGKAEKRFDWNKEYNGSRVVLSWME